MGLFRVVFFLFAASAFAKPAPESKIGKEIPSDRIRIPRHVIPLRYEIRLLPILDPDRGFPVEGSENVTIQCLQSAGNVTFHSVGMEFPRYQVFDADWEEIPVEDLQRDPDRGFVVLVLGRDLTAGQEYTLSLDFTYPLDEAAGFYRASYVEDGTTKYIAMTDFEPTDARKAFPSFDEPDLKANYSITVARGEGQVALSNMPSAGTSDVEGQPGMVWETFQTSVKMATYTVAFSVSEFVETSGESSIVSVWARRDLSAGAGYAQDIGTKMLDYFAELYGVGFSLPKLDMIALPQLGPGAMENWGLVTYREERLLQDVNGPTSASRMMGLVAIVGHELAHMWFGNLVTTKWWDNIWLNEGFASYVEYLGSAAVEPNWGWENLYVNLDMIGVLFLDALESTRSIVITVEDLQAIRTSFDSITYSKGSCVVRMMEHFLGSSTFRKGITAYLNAHQYGNAVQDDLFARLNAAAVEDGVDLGGASFDQVLNAWTLEAGYPVVEVSREGTTVTVSQRRFFLDPNLQDGTRWHIPITVGTLALGFDQTRPVAWLVGDSTGFDVELGSDDWFVLNVRFVNFYRVLYDARNYELLLEQLQADHEVVETNSRAQIVNDALNLARAGRLDYNVSLHLTGFLQKETHYTPMAAALTELSYVKDMLEETGNFEYFRAYLLSLLQSRFTPFESLQDVPAAYDDVTRWLYDSLVRRWACSMDDAECTSQAQTLFRQWRDTYDESQPDRPELSPNVKDAVFCEGVRHGQPEDWDFLYAHRRLTSSLTERGIVVQALACAREPSTLSKYLDEIVSGSGLAVEDVSPAFSAIAASPTGRPLALEFLETNWEQLRSKIGNPASLLGAFTRLNAEFELQELMAFEDRHPEDVEALRSVFDRAVEQVRLNVDWTSRHADYVSAWFQDQTRK